jgi:hypothetical protein
MMSYLRVALESVEILHENKCMNVVKLLGNHHQGVWEKREEPECQ